MGEVELGRKKLVIGGTYLVPESSSRSRTAEQLVEEIGRDIARYALEGEVVKRRGTLLVGFCVGLLF